jgi:hypothetical protein
MTDFDAIITVAGLWLSRKLDDDSWVALPQIDENSVPLVFVAAKLMEGKPYGVNTSNPDTVQRCRLLARHIGASVEIIEEEAGRTRMLFGPPTWQ